MANIWADRVLESTSTTGTGAITLAGAISGFRTFASVCSVGDVVYYYIEAVNSGGAPTGEWETGRGTYSGANTLTRTRVLASSNAGAAVNFSAGTKRVAVADVADVRKLEKFDNFADAGNSGTTETDLYSNTLTANRLEVNGDKINSYCGGIFVGSATATRQVKVYFGGTAILDTGALSVSSASSWTCYIDIIRVNSTTVRYMVTLSTQGATPTVYTSVGELTGLTLSNTQILKITGTAAGTGAASNDIVAKLGSVSFHPAA